MNLFPSSSSFTKKIVAKIAEPFAKPLKFLGRNNYLLAIIIF
jgi:hypothetical protein